MMMGVELDYEGLVFASYGRVPARSAHDLRFHAPGRPKGGAGMAVCYGDELVLKGRGDNGSWHRLGMSHVRDLEPKVRARRSYHPFLPTSHLSQLTCTSIRPSAGSRPLPQRREHRRMRAVGEADHTTPALPS